MAGIKKYFVSCSLLHNLSCIHYGDLVSDEDVERYLADNDVVFGVSFGPILVENGEPVYGPVQDLTAPDNEPLDLSQITSAYVLTKALGGLQLSVPLSLSNLRDNIRIEKILTEESLQQQELIARMDAPVPRIIRMPMDAIVQISMNT